MRLFVLTALTMVAFAANSILNRWALVDGGIDAGTFAIVRLTSGAAMLALLAVAARGRLQLGGGRGRVTGVLSLILYIYGFSLAYVSLGAGVGALILFGTVQVTMFAGALRGGARLPPRRVIGAALAFAGLVWLLWPGTGPQISVFHGAMMAAAGLGWGIYSLAGRGEADPLMATAANFMLAVPVGLVLSLASLGTQIQAAPLGLVLAVLSGAVTSGLGYALWYTVLPRLEASVAAVAQLTVPVIAMAGGLLLLAEVPSLGVVLAAAVVLGGVAFSILPQRR